MKRAIVIAALATAGAAAPAVAHHVPDSLDRPATIKRVYPDLYARELARPHPSWRHLRRMARTRYNAEHPVGYDVAHPTPEGNKRLARRMFGSAYACAKVIIDGESAWRHTVAYGGREDPALIYSGLPYGLGQANPGTKMLPWGADAATNPATQLRWFAAYARSRYGSICSAAAFWTADGHGGTTASW